MKNSKEGKVDEKWFSGYEFYNIAIFDSVKTKINSNIAVHVLGNLSNDNLYTLQY
jgi:hypothetical protein